MSNSVYTEGFLSNKNIPMCEKLGYIGFVLGGTNDKNALSFDGQSQSHSSLVCDRRGMKTPIVFTYGHPESLSPLACKTLLHNMGLDKVIPIENIFDGSRSDEEIIEELEGFYRGNPNIDKSKFSDNFEQLRYPNLTYYVDRLKNTNSYLADNPQILTELMSTTQRVCGDKKKQMTV